MKKITPQILHGKKSAQETWIQCLGQEYTLEKEMTTIQYSCLENPWTEEPGGI